MNPREFCQLPNYTVTVITTFNFDPVFFESVVLKELELAGNEQILIVADRKQIEASISNWKDQVSWLGRRYRLVSADCAGAFHPKLMLRVGKAGAALWLSSGNLTFGGWGGNRELAVVREYLFERGEGGAVRRLLERISTFAVDSLSRETIRRAIAMFPGGDELGDDDAIVFNGSETLAKTVERRLAGRQFDTARILTGSTDAGAEMAQWLNRSFGVSRVTVMVDRGRCGFLADRISGLPFNFEVVECHGGSPLHAKFVWLESPSGNAAIAGSANCSAAAWLLPAARGGNVEAVVIYEAASEVDFDDVLKMFGSEDVRPVELAATAAEADTCPANEERCRPPVVSFDSVSGIFSAEFVGIEGTVRSAFVKVDDETYELIPEDDVWNSRPTAMNRALLFCEVTFDVDGESRTSSVWINDLARLRQSSKLRSMADRLGRFRFPQPSSDHNRMLDDLGRITTALLEGSELYTDQKITEKEKASAEDDKQTSEIDPRDFIKTIKEIRTIARTHDADPDVRPSFGIEGILRAFFEKTPAPPEFGDDDEEFGLLEEGNQKAGPRPTTPAKADPPSDQSRTRFVRKLDEFLRKLSGSEFADSCSIRQLQDAVAFPFLTCDFGVKNGWLDPEKAAGILKSAFDICFSKDFGKGRKGLLAFVRDRYEAQGELERFDSVMADGTLWSVFLVTLCRSNWTGQNGEFDRGLVVRRVFSNSQLLASAETGRVARLISLLETDEINALLDESVATTAKYEALEAFLSDNSARLHSLQRSIKPAFDPGDLMFLNPNWTEAVTGARLGEKVEAYLHIRAAEKTVSTKLFLNVTKLSEHDSELQDLFRKCAEKNEDREPHCTPRAER